MTTIELTGVVRDFLIEHPDFDIVPPRGYGVARFHLVTNIPLTSVIDADVTGAFD